MNMEIIIIALCIICFAAYLFCYRYYGAEARAPIFIVHVGVLVLLVILAILLWASVANDYGQTAKIAAICGLVGYGLLLLRYLFGEFIQTKS